MEPVAATTGQAAKARPAGLRGPHAALHYGNARSPMVRIAPDDQ